MESSWQPPHRRGKVRDHSSGRNQAFPLCRRRIHRPEIQLPPRGPQSTSSFSDLLQLFEQGLGLLQVKGGEAFGEPAIDRSEKIAGLVPPSLITPKPSEPCSSAQLK